MKAHYNGFLLFFFLFFWMTSAVAKEKVYILKSPDNKNEVKIYTDNIVEYRVFHNNSLILDKSKVSMTLKNGETLGNNVVVKSTKEAMFEENTVSPFYKFPNYTSSYKELKLSFKGNYGVIFRAYNEGIAYRFFTQRKGELVIVNEESQFNFNKDYDIYVANSARESLETSSFQSLYSKMPLSKFEKGEMTLTPTTVSMNNELKLTILESDLVSYPGMYLKSQGDKSLISYFSKYPIETQKDNIRCQEMVTKRANYIAKVNGNRTFPWRVLAITEKDIEMPTNNLVYSLASPNAIGDYKWIKNGKVAWDWWNNWGLTGVNFDSGINQNTYKYYIDFASRHKMEYVILDEGWYKPQSGDVMTVIPDLDLKELIRYADSRNVKLILWTVLNSLDEKLEEACKHYSNLGIAGFKVDFLNRDDQKAVEMVERVAAMAAKYKLVVDYHGMYKPTGLNRTYPNVVNFESVFGMEEVKWTKPENDMPLYDVTMPYIRMMAGPVDYTPGAMRNATKADFKAIYYNPMSMGTRCHQAAQYIVLDSPLTMLCDSPTNYEKDNTFTNFISGIPNVYDDTKVIDGKLGEYIITARKRGNAWYVGGLTNWKERDVELSLSFLSEGSYNVTILKDGINASKNAEDYTIDTLSIDKNKSIKIKMASGGGFAIKFSKEAASDKLTCADIEINSSCDKLNNAFNWAKNKARSYVKTNSKGVINASEFGPGENTYSYIPSYVAGYPFRSAFYSRDYCHQMSGAHLLGLTEENFQMLKCFAASATAQRKYYPLWAINFDGSNYTVDYKDDNNFVREVPAPFELVEKAYKQYLWSGDDRLINDKTLWDYYKDTVTKFVELHDTQKVNGVAEGTGTGNIFKGTATYNEQDDEYPCLEAGDGIASQYAAYVSYYNFLKLTNNKKEAEIWKNKAEKFKKYFENEWSRSKTSNLYPRGYDIKGNIHYDWGKETSFLMPMKGITDQGKRNNEYLNFISNCLKDIKNVPVNIEGASYLPDLFFKYNMVDEGWKWTEYIIGGCSKKHVVKRGGTNGDYPEVSFTLISNIVENIMGIEPNAPKHELSIVSRLPQEIKFLEVKNIHIGKNIITAKHIGTSKTILTNTQGKDINAYICFYGNEKQLLVNNKLEKAQNKVFNGINVSYVKVNLSQGQEITVEREH